MDTYIIFTISLSRYPKLAKGVTLSGLVATITWSYGIGITNNFEFSFDSTYATGTQIYTSPFVRVLPYIVGAIAAWFYQEQRLQFEMSERRTRRYWHLSLKVFVGCIYSTRKVVTLVQLSNSSLHTNYKYTEKQNFWISFCSLIELLLIFTNKQLRL